MPAGKTVDQWGVDLHELRPGRVIPTIADADQQARPSNWQVAATFSTANLSQGTHTISAVYGGDTNFSGSTSGPAVIDVVTGLQLSDVTVTATGFTLDFNEQLATGSLATLLAAPSLEFKEAVPRLLDGPVPVVATVALRGGWLIAKVKARPDVRVVAP